MHNFLVLNEKLEIPMSLVSQGKLMKIVHLKNARKQLMKVKVNFKMIFKGAKSLRLDKSPPIKNDIIIVSTHI